MKIIIEGTASAVVNRDKHTLCYNAVKRSEEDLRRQFPKLKEFSLVVRKAMAVMSYHPQRLQCRHKLSSDQTSLELTFGYRLEPSEKEIIKALENELQHVKMTYENASQ